MKETFIEHIKKRLLIVALISIGVVIIIPLFLNSVLPIKTGITVMSLDAWLGFWGSFIGGIFTIIALWITIEYTSFENQKTRTQALIDSENNRRISQDENQKLRQNQLDVLKIELNIDTLDRDYIKSKEYIYTAYKVLNLEGINNLAQYPNLNFEESFTCDLQLLSLETKLLFSEFEPDSFDKEFLEYILGKIEVLIKTLGESLGISIEDVSDLALVKAKFESDDFSKIQDLVSEKMDGEAFVGHKIKEQLLSAKGQYAIELSQLVQRYLIYTHDKYSVNRKNLIGEKIATIEGDEKVPTLEWIGKDKVINHHNEVPYRVLDEVYTFGAERSVK